MDYFFQEQRWTDTFLSLHVKKFKRIILFLLIAFSAAGTKAQSDVKFNDYVRYSQWVIDSRLGDFYGNTNDFGFTTYNRDLTVKKNVTKWKNGSTNPYIDYVPGLVAKATIEAAEYYKNFDWAKPWFKSVEWYGNKCTVPTEPDNLDAINASKMYFGIYALANGSFSSNAESTTASKATTQLGNALSALKHYNETYAFTTGTTLNSKAIAGGWYHKSTYQKQMWLDGQYMGPALLAQLINGYSSYKNNKVSEDDWSLITKQFTIVWDQCWDSENELLYHAFSSEQLNYWTSDAEIWTKAQDVETKWTKMTAPGHSAAFWGRAEGWYFLALVDVLEQMQIAGLNQSTNAKNNCYNTLKGYLDKLALGIAKRQDEKSGCWYQLIGKDGNYSAQYYNGEDRGETKNYLESSCTAIFAAAFLKATRLELLSSATDGTKTYNYKDIGTNAYKGAVTQFMKQRSDGTVDLLGCCKSAGLGTNALGHEKFRDGSNAYYLHGYDVAPTSTTSNYYTEGKVMGAFIMAATEYERANEKDIRFSYDLAPTYTLAKGGSIKAEALGSGTISYQWFKSGDPDVSVATSETFTPTESGTYYCKATSGSTTIQTSTTAVTVEAASNENGGIETSNDIFSLTVTYNNNYSLTSGADLNLTTAYATVTGGSALVHNGKDIAVDIIYLKNSSSGNIALNGSSGTYAKLTLDTPLQEGDVITFTSDENSIGSFYLTTTLPKNTNCPVNDGTYTVTSSDGLVNSTVLYVWSNSSGKFKSITITRTGPSLTITTQPESKSYTVGTTTADALTVEASVQNGTGYTLEYQWYENSTNANTGGTPISRDESYTPTLPQSVGTKYYYCVVTATKSGAENLTATSDVAAITVKDKTYTVTYDMKGHGTQIDPAADLTALPNPLPKPSADGYTFVGWYTDSELNTAATAGAALTSDVTLYAKWRSITDLFTLTGVKSTTVSVSSKATVEVSSENATITGGSAVLYNGSTSSAYMITNSQINLKGSSSSYLKITLDNSLKVGDEIIINPAASSFKLSAEESNSSDKTKTVTGSYVIQNGDAVVGKNVIYLLGCPVNGSKFRLLF